VVALSPKDRFVTVYGRKPVLEVLADAGLTVDKVVRMLPPLVMSEAEGREAVSRFLPLAKAFLDKRAAA